MSASDEGSHRLRLPNNRDAGLEGLLGGRKGDAVCPVGLINLALGAVSDEGDDAVHAQFGGLFHEPLEAVVVLGGAAAYGEVVGVGVPIGLTLQDLGLGALGAVVGEAAVVERAFPVDDVDFISRAMPQDADAVAAFLGIQTAVAAAYLMCKKQFHPCKFTRMEREFQINGVLRAQGAHGVEHGQDGDAYVGEDGHPHGCEAHRGQNQNQYFDADGEADVLLGDADGAAGDLDGLGDLGGLVVHQDYVGGLDGGVGAEGAHGDADIGPCQDGGVVDAVSHEGEGAFLEELRDFVDLIGREELGVHFVHFQLGGDGGGYAFLVAGEHDGLADAFPFEGLDAFGGVFLDAVADDDVAGVLAVDGDVDDGAGMVAGMPLGAYLFHELAVADGDFPAVHRGDDAVAGGFLDAFYAAAILLVGVGVAQGLGDRVGGVALDVGGQVQELSFADDFRVHGGHFEDAFGEGAGLVEDHGPELGQLVHVVGALDEDTLAGGAAEAAEEGEGNADDQGAGTGHHQEHESAVDPGAPFAGDEAGNHGHQDSQGHDDGRVDAGEAGDEAFAAGLAGGGVFDQVQDLGGGGFAEGLGGLDLEHAALVHAAGEDLVPFADTAGYAFTGKGDGIQAGVAFEDDAVHRHFFTGLDEEDLAGGDVLGLDVLQLAAAFYVGDVRAQVHQMGDALAAAALGHFLEEFADLEEQHHEDGLGELGLGAGHEADGQRSHRGDAHEEVLAESLAVDEAFGGFLEGIPADDQVRHQEQQEVLPGGPGGVLLDEHRNAQQDGGGQDLDQAAVAFLLTVVVVMVVMVVMLVVVLVLMLVMAVLALDSVFVIFVYHGSFL